jgi:hypothetical protein
MQPDFSFYFQSLPWFWLAYRIKSKLFWVWIIAQVVEHLPTKCKALSSNSSTTKDHHHHHQNFSTILQGTPVRLLHLSKTPWLSTLTVQSQNINFKTYSVLSAEILSFPLLYLSLSYVHIYEKYIYTYTYIYIWLTPPVSVFLNPRDQVYTRHIIHVSYMDDEN